MNVQLEVPDAIGEKLHSSWRDLQRQALQALAVVAYRQGVLTSWEVQQMLGLSSRWDTEAFLQEAGAPLAYDAADLDADLATLRQLGRE